MWWVFFMLYSRRCSGSSVTAPHPLAAQVVPPHATAVDTALHKYRTVNYFTMENTCTCGDTRLIYYPDENQHEPACWYCYFDKSKSQTKEEQASTDSKEEEDLPF